MSRIRIAGRNVAVKDIAMHGAGRAWAKTSPRTPSPLAGRDLRRGDHGREVALLREDLRRAGIPGVVPGGLVFDDALEERVRAFQLSARIRSDGRVGRATREALARAAH